MKVAIIGSQGVPSSYGGFESLVENIISNNASKDIEYTVFCGGKDYYTHLKQYKGARLKYIPLHANGVQSTLYDILSMVSCIGKGYNAVLVLGVSGCMFLPVFRLLFHQKIIVNIDGLEHKRSKWGKFAKWFLRSSEAMAVRVADTVIADNKGIQDYVMQTYGKHSELIAYGGDHAIRYVSEERSSEIINRFKIKNGRYAISVCRIEPENNCHIVLDAFAHSNKELYYIGNWSRSDYGRELKQKYSPYANIHITDSIYDLDALYILRSNAGLYVHGHSAGGTNPSLVEAMHFGIPIAAYDVIYNRETTENKAIYFRNSFELSEILNCKQQFSAVATDMKAIASREYVWKEIAKKYEKLYYRGKIDSGSTLSASETQL